MFLIAKMFPLNSPNDFLRNKSRTTYLPLPNMLLLADAQLVNASLIMAHFACAHFVSPKIAR